MPLEQPTVIDDHEELLVQHRRSRSTSYGDTLWSSVVHPNPLGTIPPTFIEVGEWTVEPAHKHLAVEHCGAGFCDHGTPYLVN